MEGAELLISPVFPSPPNSFLGAALLMEKISSVILPNESRHLASNLQPFTVLNFF